MKKQCPCVTKWIKEIKIKYDITDEKYCARLDVNSESNCVMYRKFITPTDYRESKESRLSKRWRYNEYKQYEFCPFCGKKLEEDVNVAEDGA